MSAPYRIAYDENSAYETALDYLRENPAMTEEDLIKKICSETSGKQEWCEAHEGILWALEEFAEDNARKD